MFYREVGDLKTSYREDQAVLTITQERFFVLRADRVHVPRGAFHRG